MRHMSKYLLKIDQKLYVIMDFKNNVHVPNDGLDK